MRGEFELSLCMMERSSSEKRRIPCNNVQKKETSMRCFVNLVFLDFRFVHFFVVVV